MADSPAGTGATGCDSGNCSTNVSASRPTGRVASEEIGLKGVVITCTELGEVVVDLGVPCLHRRLTKMKIPITKSMTPTPPMTAPAIAGMFDFICDDVAFVVAVVGMLSSTGALREGPCQS